MAKTTIAAKSTTFPVSVSQPVIDWRRDWSDAWTYEPALHFVGGKIAAGAADLSYVECERRYGRVIPIAGAAEESRDVWDLDGVWIRLRMLQNNALVTQFVGRVYDERRSVGGGDVGPSGTQRFVAYGPKQILRRVPVNVSYWANSTDPVGWIPDFNAGDELGLSVGNKYANEHPTLSGVYTFADPADAELWSRFDMLISVLGLYVQVANGPQWTVTGEVDALKSLTDRVRMSDAQTADDVVSAIMPRQFGLDYAIEPNDNGYQIRVFSLSDKAWRFRDVTLPANRDRVEISTTDTVEANKIEIARSRSNQYDYVRVRGQRIVVATTFKCSASAQFSTLFPAWSADLERMYLDAVAGTAAENDASRKADLFSPVYQAFRASASWDHAGGPASPYTDDVGDVARDIHNDFDAAAYQNGIKTGLPWLPFREGLNYAGGSAGWVSQYTTGPPTRRITRNAGEDALTTFLTASDFVDLHTHAGTRWSCTIDSLSADDVTLSGGYGAPWPASLSPAHVCKSLHVLPTSAPPQYLSPQSWVYDENELQYVPASNAGITVSALRTALGVQLSVTPNHVLGYGTFDTATPAAEATDTEPITDYRKVYVTLAFEADQRFEMRYGSPPATTGNPDILDVAAPDAELWLATPGTVFGFDETGSPLQVGGDGLVLRNDADRVALTMAGAIMRYWDIRGRGDVALRGFHAWANQVGSILDVIEVGSNAFDILAPVSSVEWSIAPPTTRIATGYVR
jgi:hypothetical protein